MSTHGDFSFAYINIALWYSVGFDLCVFDNLIWKTCKLFDTHQYAPYNYIRYVLWGISLLFKRTWRLALEPKKDAWTMHPTSIFWSVSCTFRCLSMSMYMYYIYGSMRACLSYLITSCKALCRMAIRLKPFLAQPEPLGTSFWGPWQHMWVAGLLGWSFGWYRWCLQGLTGSNFSKPLTLKDLQSWTKPRMPWAQRNNSKTSRGVSLCWKVSVRQGDGIAGQWSFVLSMEVGLSQVWQASWHGSGHDSMIDTVMTQDPFLEPSSVS